MIYRIIYGVCLMSLLACAQKKTEMKHVFYLHGMIIESKGIHAVSDQFGAYEYTQIVDSLRATGAEVHSEVRTEDTDFDEFCRKVSSQVDELIDQGIPPENITVIGASKGGMMAMNISSINTNPINYVLLGASSSYAEKTFNWSLHGNILGIYEASDTVADKDYQFWMDRSPEAKHFEQLELHTGLSHGFLYRPIPEWLNPARKWMGL